ncbi:TonB-dependent receptor [Lutibacter sp. A64]|uniref:TonB-dependent receptor n=1 Tax=Lutibacter sp. A64 TaxID=2918526 RepID=UPI001F063A76|nr:TonB-dependent receptor [Lutibacter sp. A64]UMB54441.1 TonB-dependent receptor [Lutibacter sp. A64]
MKIFLGILFVGLSFVAQAQHTISGTITDTNNQPLLGVEVFVEELHKGTSTDENGYFELNNLPNNTIKLTIVFLGYKTQIKTVELNIATTELTFILEESVFKMDEVIISTPFNKLQSENVMKVEKATIAQLQNKGMLTLSEGISSLPGVSTIATGTGIGKPVIRGLRGNRVLVYSQGLRLENQQFGDEHGLGVDASSIESLEVIKGPASLLYGSDALGGVLYFNPIKFAPINSFNISGGQTFYSNTAGSSTLFSAKQSYNKWKFLVNGSHNTHSDYKTANDERVTNTRFNETNFNTAIGYNSERISSIVRFLYNRSIIGIPEEIGVQSTSKEKMLPYQDLTTKMLSLNNTIFLNNSKISTVFGYTENLRNEFEEHDHDEHLEQDDHDNEAHVEEEDHESEEAALQLKLDTYSYDIKWHLPKFNSIETVIGVQGMHQKNKNFGEEILIPDATTNDVGVFVTAMYQISNSSFQGGFRFDTRNISTAYHEVLHEDEIHIFEAIDKTFDNISASIGYKTLLFNTVISRFNVASGFKAPNLAELTSNGVHHGSNRFELGNTKLKQEQNLQSDISFEYKTDHFELVANGFYNHINDYIFISPTGEVEDGNDVYSYTQENAKLYGGEFGLHLHPHPLDWLHLNSNFELVVGKQDNGDYLPLIPANKLTNTIRAEFNNTNTLQNGFASITLENTFKQTNISEFETKSNAYNLINVGVGGTVKFNKLYFDVNLNVNNVFNESYISHLSRLKSDGILNIGRNFITSIKFKF